MPVDGRELVNSLSFPSSQLAWYVLSSSSFLMCWSEEVLQSFLVPEHHYLTFLSIVEL